MWACPTGSIMLCAGKGRCTEVHSGGEGTRESSLALGKEVTETMREGAETGGQDEVEAREQERMRGHKGRKKGDSGKSWSGKNLRRMGCTSGLAGRPHFPGSNFPALVLM